MLLYLINFQRKNIVDGGTNRELALGQFVGSRNGTELLIQDDFFKRLKINRLLKLPQVLIQIFKSKNKILILSYPGYPFFWQHKVTPYFFVSIFFSLGLFIVKKIKKIKVIIDVADLPVFQYKDLNVPMEIHPRVFRIFDFITFHCADELWICSNSLAKLMKKEYKLHRKKIKVVLNGAFKRNFVIEQKKDDIFRFVYAGGLIRERGIENLVDSFLKLPSESVELNLCGFGGEWLKEKIKDERIKYWGAMTDEESAKLASKCDVGIIIYPPKGYYNYAFATKFAFYVTLGLPILCTNAEETAEAVQKYKVGIVSKLENLTKNMELMIKSKELLNKFRRNEEKIKEKFYWDNIYSQALGEV